MQDIWQWVLGLGVAAILANVVVFAVLERFWPAEPDQPVSGYWLNLKITAFYLIGTTLLTGISTALVAWCGARLGTGLFDLRFSAGHGLPVQTLGAYAAVVVVDFFYYWFHRFQHTIPALWSQHKVHHADEHVNASSALRHHWTEELLRVPMIAIPMAVLFKIDPAPAGLAGVLFASWGYFIHANLRLNMGPLTPLLGGPQVHRIHHSIEPEHYDKNFAAFFPVWDMLFGTFHYPKRGEFPATGVIGERYDTAAEASLVPFVEWGATLKRRCQKRNSSV